MESLRGACVVNKLRIRLAPKNMLIQATGWRESYERAASESSRMRLAAQSGTGRAPDSYKDNVHAAIGSPFSGLTNCSTRRACDTLITVRLRSASSAGAMKERLGRLIAGTLAAVCWPAVITSPSPS